LLKTTAFPQWLWNTMLIAIVSTVISLICGMFAGYALARLKFRGSEFLGTAIFITYLVPQTLLFIPLADVINQLNLGNTLTSVILTYPTMLVPFCV
jgi:multiple sugar transport system permease protein